MSDTSSSTSKTVSESSDSEEKKENPNLQEDSSQSQERFKVNKKGFIEAEGEVEELLPGLKFKVVLDNGHEIIATLAGRMRIHKIMLIAGDRVRVEMSPYDLTKGRVTYRF